MTDLEIIRAARRRAHEFAAQGGDSDQAAIDGYQEDALFDEINGLRRDLWNHDQELIYRNAFAWQLLALGL